MFYVPLYFEALRVRPVLLFWLVTLAQALLWIAVPLLFYSAPPGDLPQVLAIGHEFPVDGGVAPPLLVGLRRLHSAPADCSVFIRCRRSVWSRLIGAYLHLAARLSAPPTLSWPCC